MSHGDIPTSGDLPAQRHHPLLLGEIIRTLPGEAWGASAEDCEICAGTYERSCNCFMSSHKRQHQSGKAKLRTNIEIGAVAHQAFHNGQMALVGGEHECCLAVRI